MTTEQKIEWLANASGEELMKQYESDCMFAFQSTMSLENRMEFIENVKLDKAEIMKRLCK